MNKKPDTEKTPFEDTRKVERGTMEGKTLVDATLAQVADEQKAATARAEDSASSAAHD